MFKLAATIVIIAVSSVATALAQSNTAPDFALPDLDGKYYKLSENLQKGPILINFWATWCVPCRTEMKKLRGIHQKYESDSLVVLSIAIDDPKTVGKVKSYVNTNKFPYKFLLDTNNEVFRLYRGTNPPMTVLLNREGQIVYTHTGYRKGDEKKLDKQIARLVARDASDDSP